MTRPFPNNASEVRVPPQDLEAEQSTLGAMFLSEKAVHEVSAVIKADDFYREANRKIFTAIMNLNSKGNPVDVITVSDELNRMGEFDAVGGVAALTALIERVPTAANAEYYAIIVKEKSRLRWVIEVGTKAVSDAFVGAKYSDEITGTLVDQMVNHENFSQVSEPHSLAIEACESITDNKVGLYIETGFPDFDEKIKGIKRGVVSTVTGESEVGKSTWMQNICLSMAKRKLKTVYVYLEDSPMQLAKRHVCMMQSWSIDRLESSDPKVLDFHAKTRAFSDWGDLGIRVWSRKQVGLQWKTLKLWMLREYKKNHPDIFFIDGCERLQLSPMYQESRWDAQERMIGEMEDVAQNLGVGFVCIVGQAKTSKMAKSNGFIDENEGGSNSWRKLARMRFLVHRHEKAEIDPEYENISIVKVTKNSDGNKGSFWFRGERSTYRWKEFAAGKGEEA